MTKPRPEAQPFATPDEVAAFLRVSPRTLKYWRSTGRGPAWGRSGRRIRYLWKDVRSYAARRITWSK